MDRVIENVKTTLPPNYKKATFNIIDSMNIININNYDNNMLEPCVEISENLLQNFCPHTLENWLVDILHKIQCKNIIITKYDDENLKKNHIQIQTKTHHYFYEIRTRKLIGFE